MKLTNKEKIIFSVQIIFSCIIIFAALKNYFFITGNDFSQAFPQVEIEKSTQIKATASAVIKGFLGIIGILLILKNKKIGYILSIIFWCIQFFGVFNFLIHQNLNDSFWINLIFSVFIVIIVYILFISLKKTIK